MPEHEYGLHTAVRGPSPGRVLRWMRMDAFTGPASQARLRAVGRESPWIADLVLAAFIALIGTFSRPSPSFSTPEQAVYSVIVLGCSIALIFRRHRPRVSLAVVAALLAVHLVVVQELTVFAGVACLLCAYTSQTQMHPPWRWGYVTAIYIGTAIAVLTSPDPGPNADSLTRAVMAAACMALITIAVLAGIVRRSQIGRYEHALERTAFLEARRDVERRLAAVEERTRIAREMHDVLGHSLNTIAIQAEAVRYVGCTDPDRTDRVLADIGRLSRNAVDDVRDLINVLATDDDSNAPARPTPTLCDVRELIGDLQYTRAVIRLHVEGDLSTVPDQVGLAGYRIIQESLTNVLKHAEGATAVVRIHVQFHTVELTILNSSTGRTQLTGADGSQQGIVGMQERAHALGGTFSAGPDPHTGGWRVAARLPWRRQ